MTKQFDSIAAGSVFTGTVTQSGVMTLDGPYRYRALQACTLTVESVTGRIVKCKIRRVECDKLINGSSVPSPSMPEYLRMYLNTWGSCVEHAAGVYDPLSGALLLDGGEPTAASALCVQWDRHQYALIVIGRTISGCAFSMEKRDDRVSEVGIVRVDAVYD